MKIVGQSLNEYYDKKYFNSLNEEKEDENYLKDKESAGIKVIDKIKKDFEKFKKESKGEISNYKKFWEENKKIKEIFGEDSEVYKMYGSDYVVGVLSLPVSSLSDGSIDGGMGATEEDLESDEEIVEGKVNEAEEDEFDADIDLNFDENSEEGAQELTTDDQSTSLELPDANDNVQNTEDQNTEISPEKTSQDTINDNKIYFVLYNLKGEQKEEILRTGSSNVIKAFKQFYADVFKTSMKNAIIKYTEKKKEEKLKAEKSVKQKKEKEKDSKLKSFLSENYRKLNKFKLLENSSMGSDFNDWLHNVITSISLMYEVDYEIVKENIDDDIMIQLEEYYLDDISAEDTAEILSLNNKKIMNESENTDNDDWAVIGVWIENGQEEWDVIDMGPISYEEAKKKAIQAGKTWNSHVNSEFRDIVHNEYPIKRSRLLDKLKEYERITESLHTEKGFNAHGYFVLNNSTTYLIELSDDGEMGRINDDGKITDWLPIEWIEDEGGWSEDEPILDPDGYYIPLNRAMKINR